MVTTATGFLRQPVVHRRHQHNIDSIAQERRYDEIAHLHEQLLTRHSSGGICTSRGFRVD